MKKRYNVVKKLGFCMNNWKKGLIFLKCLFFWRICMIVYQNQNSGKKYHFWSSSSENYSIAAHLHDYTEVVYVKSGCLTVKLDSERYDVHAGEAVIVLPHRVHEYINESGNSVCGVIFQMDLFRYFLKRLGTLCLKILYTG